MKKIYYKILTSSLVLFSLFFSIFSIVNNTSFYEKQYLINNTTYETGMSIEDLSKSTKLLLDYLNDKTDNLSMRAEKFGKQSEVFDNREKTHMIDVKNLYLFFKNIMYIIFLISFILLIYLFKKDKNKIFWNEFYSAYKFSAIIIAIIISIIIFAFIYDFNSFWNLFHKLLFRNDLWLLDPQISTMINMFPLNFFLAMCTKIVFCFSAISILIFMFAKFMHKKKISDFC